jgi:hypothetical protein
MDLAASIIDGLTSVTKKWTKQQKAEERSASARYRRDYVYSDRVNFTDVAAKILPRGYAHASGDGKYTVDKRQFYYAVRDEFLKETGREISADYFSQNVLVKYMNQHPEETARWKITASPRGTLSIPNAGFDCRIPCGTLAIEEHLDEARATVDPFETAEDAELKITWPSLAERQRYQAVLYIEKEGFDPQLREARIAERFDVAIISCKGQSVVAARQFVDHACRVNGGVPLFVMHDMDKAGFEIAQRLTTVSYEMEEKNLVKYQFQNDIDVTDLGLRLADVHKYNLKSERVRFKGTFPFDTIATAAEQEFLRSNRRVELNAFTAPDFIRWIESKLRKYLKERLVPADAILADAYRRALYIAKINRAIEEAKEEAIEFAKAAEIPDSLRRQLAKRLKAAGAPAWDEVLYDLAESMLTREDDN